MRWLLSLALTAQESILGDDCLFEDGSDPSLPHLPTPNVQTQFHTLCLIHLYLVGKRARKPQPRVAFPQRVGASGGGRSRGEHLRGEHQVGSVLCQVRPEGSHQAQIREHALRAVWSLPSPPLCHAQCHAHEEPANARRDVRGSVCGSSSWFLPCPSLEWLNGSSKTVKPLPAAKKTKMLT